MMAVGFHVLLDRVDGSGAGVGRIRTPVNEDVSAIESAIVGDSIIVGVNPDGVSLSYVDEMDLKEGVGGDGVVVLFFLALCGGF